MAAVDCSRARSVPADAYPAVGIGAECMQASVEGNGRAWAEDGLCVRVGGVQIQFKVTLGAWIKYLYLFTTSSLSYEHTILKAIHETIYKKLICEVKYITWSPIYWSHWSKQWNQVYTLSYWRHRDNTCLQLTISICQLQDFVHSMVMVRSKGIEWGKPFNEGKVCGHTLVWVKTWIKARWDGAADGIVSSWDDQGKSFYDDSFCDDVTDCMQSYIVHCTSFGMGIRKMWTLTAPHSSLSTRKL